MAILIIHENNTSTLYDRTSEVVQENALEVVETPVQQDNSVAVDNAINESGVQ